MTNDFGISLDDAISELRSEVEEAINFMWSEYGTSWERAERYYAGECDLPSEVGRSNAVKTEVRDIIRALTPNVMRVLYQARKPVEYIPSDIRHAAFIEQQGLFVNQTFAANNGYRILYNAVQQAAKLKIGPIKTWWEEEPMPEYFKATGLTEEEVEGLKATPDVEMISIEDSEKLEGFYDVEGRHYLQNGRIVVEDFPVYEFFVSRNANDLETAKVHGHHRAIKVAQAIEMGLEYDDWADLTGPDPETKNAAGQARARRGYSPDGGEKDSDDLLQKEILLTEVYCKYDLDGDGVEKRYCFVLGGSQYEYITHYEIEDYCIDLVQLDPQPHTVVGRSIPDIAVEMQDNETSILRAIVDNAHMANNPRHAADPSYTDFSDLMNNAIGAPIKTRGNPAIQTIDIPFTGAQLIPFLQYMEQDTEQRVGVTKAATGLDADAMQSTDKEAVKNTIALSQGQIELMVRNVVETALISVFKKVLKLSVRHMDRMQIVRTKGELLPIDITMFDTNLAAEPNVGLGTASHEQKLSTLGFILQKQEQIIGTMGMDNPFTSLSQVYNTLEDLVELGGLRDPGRYFKIVTPDMERRIAEAKAKEAAAAAQAAQQNQPMDPSKTLIQVEEMKLKGKQLEIMSSARQKELELQYKATKDAEELDLKRDEMIQNRIIELRQIGQDRLNTMIERKQAANDTEKTAKPTASANGQPTDAGIPESGQATTG